MSDRTTKFFFYCSVLLVAASSVVFGLDWLPARMPPMLPIKGMASAPPPTPPSPLAAANPVTPQPVEPMAAAPPPPALQKPSKPQKPLCDVSACAAAYRTFRESDCTYNPSFGPRRLCTKGVVPAAPAPAPAADAAQASIANPEPDADAPSNARCNVSACAAAYGSFTVSDCTYQPLHGPRRLCAK